MKTQTFLFALFITLPLMAMNDKEQHHAHSHEQHHEHHHIDEAATANASEHQHHGHAASSDIADRALNHADSGQGTVWTCPMHPQISRSGPGQCPVCGMNLVQREVTAASASSKDSVSVHVSGRIQHSMNLRTAIAGHGRLSRRIDTVGRVQVDETRLIHIHPRVDGWIGELDVNAVGEPVEVGQRLFTLYSRELVNAQEEFLHALSSNSDMADAARQRLSALDIQPEVISIIERERQLFEYLPWYALNSGYVNTLNIRPGKFVSPGIDMIVMADPDQVWVMADVFGQQIAWVEPGQTVEIRREAEPGEIITAEVDFIYPELDPETRTATARIGLEGSAMRIGEWVRVRFFIETANHVLFVPTEAVIESGRGTRIVVREDDTRFSVREVRTGMVTDGYTEILSGISAGEEVVSSGQFLIDSEANLRAGFDRLGDSHD